MNAIATVSVLLSVVTYAALLIFSITNWFRGVTGLALLLASTMTLLWVTTLLFTLTQRFYLVLEPVVIVTWTFLIVRALGFTFTQQQPEAMRPVLTTFAMSVIAATIATSISAFAVQEGFFSNSWLVFHLILVIENVIGLVLVEQLTRNARTDLRWRLRYLTIGLSMLFGFGLVHHALAILFNGPVLILSVLQPVVVALLVPFVAIASLRNRTNKLRFSLSRDVVFRTGVLVSSGVFLLALGLLGYIAQVFAGEIGVTVAVFFGIVGVAFFLIVVGSSRFRSQLRVQLSKALFEYRYDYRDEWMKVTAQLTEPDVDFDLSQQAQRAILAVLHATRSCLWTLNDQGTFVPASHLNAQDWAEPIPPRTANAIKHFYEGSDWVLDLSALPESANEIAHGIDAMFADPGPNYVVPLFVDRKLFGICLIGPSEVSMQLSWEDYDIIKLISKQGAGFLALQRANKYLMEQEQLSTVNQMSAFLLHDIKTISSQLSLMLENAEQHKGNPAFIDDMLKTTQNSVQRMTKIIAGLRAPQKLESLNLTDFDLSEFLHQRMHKPTLEDVRIEYHICQGPVMIRADRAALATAIEHLEQNALEAVDRAGSICVNLSASDCWALVHITDDGEGMSDAFVKNELFKPFHSTKGLSGMGIGAYQARDKIRACGGDLQVESKLGLGTTFTIKLPLIRAELEL